MTRLTLTALALIGLTATAPAAQDAPAAPAATLDGWIADHGVIVPVGDLTLDDLAWIARPIVVFADSPNQPQFVEQMRLLQQDMAALALRDVIVITDTDPAARSAIRQALRPRGFSLVLLDKDGTVNFRKPDPWNVREISRQIDKMPLRLQEIRQGLAPG
jgi:hypothetical protein